MRVWLASSLVALAALAAGTPARGEEPTAAGGGLDLSVRARALGVAVEPVSPSDLGLETVTAPTGAGSTRLPQVATSRARGGVYLGVGVCDPVWGSRVYEVRADDPGTVPEGGNLRGAPGPHIPFVPGRP